MKTKTILTTLALASLVGFAPMPVMAKPDNDAHGVTLAKIYLRQAVDTAEQHVKGIASRAEFEQEKSGPVYEVEVVTQTKVYDVKIDANKGTVLATREDKKDHDEGREEEHHHEDHEDKD
jgi:hypothetical protein